MAVEVEARFRAETLAPLQRLTRASTLGDAKLGPASTAVEEDRYLDTADGRLASARWACRLRRRGSDLRVSLKGPPDEATTGWLHRRPEVEGPASASPDPAGWPTSEARALLLELSGGEPLRERLRLEQTRTERAVTLDGQRLGVLTLDVVTALRAGTLPRELLLVELELDADATDAERELPRLAGAILAVGELSPEPRTKLELALEGG
jgi:inorganic triphosphatase YgiF